MFFQLGTKWNLLYIHAFELPCKYVSSDGKYSFPIR